MPRDWVAYVGDFTFPWGQPGSRRVAGIAKSIARYRDVVILSTAIEKFELTTLEEDEEEGTIKYLNPRSRREKIRSRSGRAINYFLLAGIETVNWLTKSEKKPTHIIIYGGSFFFVFFIIRWAKRNGISVIADVVEWYSPKQLKGGRFGPLYLSAVLTRNLLFPRCNGIIAISRYLFEHFEKRVLHVARIPPTLSVTTAPTSNDNLSKRSLTLAYAGTPGKKDLIFPVLEALRILQAEGLNVKLIIAGPTPFQLSHSLGITLPDFVEAVGKVPQDKVGSLLASADFSILFRNAERFTQAGFPTKFVESMAAGLPVICNISSDLDIYMQGEEVGLISPSADQADVTATLRRAANLPEETKRRMRENARMLALKEFDYKNYTEPLDVFLKALTSSTATK